MTTRFLRIGRLSLMVLAADLMLQPILLRAMEIEDRKAERRVIVTLSASDAPAALSALLGRAAMLHAFRVEVLDARGEAVRMGVAFEVTLSTAGVTLVRLNQRAREVVLPKPLGYRVEATDSIRIVASFAERRDAQLRLTMHYEAGEGATSRLAVRPLAQVESMVDAGASRSWSWRADSTGRMLAIAGAGLAGARELMLEDAVTGAVVWHSVVGQATQAQRLGVVVHAGGVYRLTARYDVVAAHDSSDAIVALALPRR